MKLENATDAALLRYERMLDRAIERERGKLHDFFDDPYTTYYGVGEELAPLVYQRGRKLEWNAEMLYFELVRRGIRKEW